jgi:hypothetical protein
LPVNAQEKGPWSDPRASNWVQGLDLNQRPSGYEAEDLLGRSVAKTECTCFEWKWFMLRMPLISSLLQDPWSRAPLKITVVV